MKKIRVECRLSSKQSQILESKSQKHGKTKSECLREAAFAYWENRYLVPAGVEMDLSTLVFLFRNMANNINQIAKYANTFRRLRIVDALALKGTVQEMERLVDGFVRNPIENADDR